MKVTVFTSNQPRHLHLVKRLAEVADEVFAVLECNTVFPGQVADFYRDSETMQRYFSNVRTAETHFFGTVQFTPQRAQVLPIRAGDLNGLPREVLLPALNSDAFVVFGSSFIKGWLVDFLVEKQALNIHMGVSPYYRGSSCNFWALFDANPAMVGATIHALTRGLDSGPVLRHAIPRFTGETPEQFTMKAVLAAQESLVSILGDTGWRNCDPVPQDPSAEIRYSRNADFTDDVASIYLDRQMTPGQLEAALSTSKQPEVIRPFYL